MMKIYYLIIAVSLFITLPVKSQLFKRDKHAAVKKRIESNFDFLSKSNVYVGSIFKIGEDGVSVMVHDDLEYFLNYDDVDRFLSLARQYDMYQLRGHYLNNPDSRDIDEINIPDKKKIRIALDPGHFASNKEESIFEDRYVKYRFDSADQDTFINEASLNFQIAKILENKLKEAGYEVLLTRKDNESAVGVDFNTWMSSGQYRRDLKELVERDEITFGKANVLLEKENRGDLFNEVYTFLDFKSRAFKINGFNPDITLVIHLNASEDFSRDEQGYSSLTKENYSMAFVPGGFMLGELEKVDQRIDFLRLLVSDNIQESKVLSSHFIEAIETGLGVPPHRQEEVYSSMIQYNTVSTMHNGIYARNLYMTRAIESKLSYLEISVQNNKEELIKLATHDYKYKGEYVSARVYEIASALYEGIVSHQMDNN